MFRISAILLLCIGIACFTGCGKNGSSNQAHLMYGKWASAAPKDTLYFFARAGKNIMLSSITTSPSSPVKMEQEYRLIDGKLSVGYDNQGRTEFYEFSTFNWVQVGRTFEMNGNQRFPILSSIQPMYTYEKIQ